MDTSKIALSPYGMLAQAVYDHMDLHEGKLPKMFILHPMVWRSVLSCNRQPAVNFGTIQSPEFGGIPVRLLPSSQTPKMMDCQDKLIEL